MKIGDPTNFSQHELLTLIPELKDLRGIIENNPWHTNDDVFVHTMSVFQHVQNNLRLDFVTNEETKEKIHCYLSERVGDLTNKEILLWATLLHDCAKSE